MRRAGCCSVMPLILTLDAALAGCGAGVVRDGVVLGERRQAGGRGSAAALPAMAEAVLRDKGIAAGDLDAVVATVGPGSFTGVRAALALAQGIGAASRVPVWGVTVGMALRAGVSVGRPVWVAVDSRRGRVFLDDGERVIGVELDDLPAPAGAVALAGDAANAVASRLAGRGFDVMLLDLQEVRAAGIALASMQAIEARPLYVDAPEARVGRGMRPAPV